MPFSFRRDSEISPSEKSSQTAPCVFRSIRTPTLRPFSSVTNWIPVMALFSFRWRHTRIVHVQPRPRNSASLPFPPIFSGIQKGPYATRRTETPVPAMHGRPPRMSGRREIRLPISTSRHRSEEHTSELQSPCNLVCRLLLEKKNKNHTTVVLDCLWNGYNRPFCGSALQSDVCPLL